MNRYWYIGIIGCTLTTSPALAQNTPTSKIAPSKGWLSDFASARAQALKTGKPMMIVFRCDP
jgi:hypothetical protein